MAVPLVKERDDYYEKRWANSSVRPQDKPLWNTLNTTQRLRVSVGSLLVCWLYNQGKPHDMHLLRVSDIAMDPQTGYSVQIQQLRYPESEPEKITHTPTSYFGTGLCFWVPFLLDARWAPRDYTDSSGGKALSINLCVKSKLGNPDSTRIEGKCYLTPLKNFLEEWPEHKNQNFQ